MRRDKKILRGMHELEKLTKMDEATIKQAVKKDGFPAALIKGRWRAVEEDVVRWLRAKISHYNGA